MNARKKAKQLKKINKELQAYKDMFMLEQFRKDLQKNYETEIHRNCAAVRMNKYEYLKMKASGGMLEYYIKDRLAEQYKKLIFDNMNIQEETDEDNEKQYKMFRAELYISFK